VQILMIDNYDSFTYNLVQYLGELGAVVDVVRNDAVSVEALLGGKTRPAGQPRQPRQPAGLVISPGPGTPDDGGVSVEACRAFAERGTPVLGVCLGHQCIGVACGGRIVRARSIMHGKVSQVEHDGRGLFAGIPSPFEATRYHSLVIEEASFPPELEVCARSEDGEVMAVRHRDLPLEGVQFHPESIKTEVGHDLLGNFLRRCERAAA
jgi:anthranilate synthase component 2